MAAVGLLINVLVLNSPLKDLTIIHVPGGLLTAGMALLAFGSSLLALSLVNSTRSPVLQDRERAPWLTLWFALLGLLVTPTMFGIVAARILLETPANLRCAVVVNGGVERCLPIIYFGTERIYCLRFAGPSDPSEVVPVQWPDVRAVRFP